MQKFLKFCLLGTVIGFSWHVFATSAGGGSAFENLAVKPFEGVVKGTGAAVSGVTKGAVNIVNGTVRTVAGGVKQVWNGTTWVAENAWSGVKSGSAWVAEGVDSLLSKTTDNAGNIINGTTGAVTSGTKGWNLTLDPSIAKEGFGNIGSTAGGVVSNPNAGSVLTASAIEGTDYVKFGNGDVYYVGFGENGDGTGFITNLETGTKLTGTFDANGNFTPNFQEGAPVQMADGTYGTVTAASEGMPGSGTVELMDGRVQGIDINAAEVNPGAMLPGDSVTLRSGGAIDGLTGSQYEVEAINGDQITVVDVDGNKAVVDASKLESASKLGDASKADSLMQSQSQSAESAMDQAKQEVIKGANPLQLANETNAAQYAIVILQAVEGTNQEDATREVTVQVEKFIESQGSPSGSSIGPSVSLNGTTLSGAALAMANLLSQNPVDAETLLKIDDIEDCSGAPANISATKTEGILDDCVRDEIRNRRRLLLQMYGAAAQLIAGGSNSISADFYTRVRGVASAAKSTLGTLGAMSVVNDSERYPYFELVRQMALSSVQLGLKGANNLTLVDIADEGSAE